MSICLSFHIGIWTISLYRNDRTRVLMLSCSYINLYIPHEAWAIVYYLYRAVQSLNVVIFNSSHAFLIYVQQIY